MASQKEGGSVVRPPLLEGNNYTYWKMRIKSFIRSLDENAWTAVEVGWSIPTTTEGANKPRDKWTAEELAASCANQKALNSIQSAVSMEVFTLISMCESAKEAWEVLQNTYEGDSRVKSSRLQQLTSRFEALKMQENETITDYNTKVLAIANESFSLGKKIKQKKLVQKVLRSLNNKFHTKKTAIEESRDLTSMKLDELIGSLRTYEMGLNEEKEKGKNIAFVGEVTAPVPTDVLEGYEAVVESIAMFTKNMGKSLEQLKKKGAPQFKNFKGDPKKVSDKTKNEKTDMSKIQCFECGGFGHFASECANTLRKKNKAYNTTLSDDEVDDTDSETGGDNVAFTGRIIEEDQSDEIKFLENDIENNSEDPDFDTFIENYNVMHNKCLTLIDINKGLTAQITTTSKEKEELTTMINVLKEENLRLQQI